MIGLFERSFEKIINSIIYVDIRKKISNKRIVTIKNIIILIENFIF